MLEHLQNELETGVQSLGLSLQASVLSKLINYLSLLDRWNKTFNLTAIRDPQAMVNKHLLDSLAVLPFIGDGKVLDVGSGAGLPGIPLALSKPQQAFTLIDTNGKKTRFLNQVKIELGLDNVTILNQRVERCAADIYFDVIIARAYAGTDDIIKTTQHLHTATTRVLVMQGRLEQSLSMPGYVVNQVHQLEVPGLRAERHLLEIIKSE